MEEVKLTATMNILKDTLEKAGYQLKTENNKVYATKTGYTLKCIILPSPETLKSEFEKAPGEYQETVVVVPTGPAVKPFKELYTEESNKLLDMQTVVWVANIQNHTLSPFIGVYPGEKKDKELVKYFDKPDLASRVPSTWKVELD